MARSGKIRIECRSLDSLSSSEQIGQQPAALSVPGVFHLPGTRFLRDLFRKENLNSTYAGPSASDQDSASHARD